MSRLPEAFGHYLNMWNERNPDLVRGLLDRAVSEDMIFADPRDFHVGRGALHKNARRFRRAFQNADLSITGGVDSQHDRYRYEWRIADRDKVILDGFDVATINADGLIERVDGFFGQLPAAIDPNLDIRGTDAATTRIPKTKEPTEQKDSGSRTADPKSEIRELRAESSWFT
jgi:hypothetical protein